MSSRWNHLLCDVCWDKLHPNRAPVRLKDDSGQCCVCRAVTTSGIYIRADPAEMPCNGTHA